MIKKINWKSVFFLYKLVLIMNHDTLPKKQAQIMRGIWLVYQSYF